MSRSNFLDRLQQVSPGIVPFMAATTRGGRAGITNSGNKGKGIGGGGGIPGSGNGGGNGGGGGRPTPEGAGNNLSFPAYFASDKPALRQLDNDPKAFQFGDIYKLDTNDTDTDKYYYFAQGTDNNVWQAENISGAPTTPIDYVDIGDALESAPTRVGAKVRFELSLYEKVPESTLNGFSMTLLGGAKGDGKPDKKGPTELQGARLSKSDEWTPDQDPFVGSVDDAPQGTTFESYWASVYTTNMRLSIQKLNDSVTGNELDPNTLEWDGGDDIWTGDLIASGNLFGSDFGPELNIGGKYILGASEKPFIFTEPGSYIVTFAIDYQSSISFDTTTAVGNLVDPSIKEAQEDGSAPFDTPIGGLFATIAGNDEHNGLIYAILNVQA